MSDSKKKYEESLEEEFKWEHNKIKNSGKMVRIDEAGQFPRTPEDAVKLDMIPNSAKVSHKEEVDTENSNKKGGAKRYNKGKSRHVLIPPFAKEALADVYTRGAHKYSMYKDKNGNLIQGKDIPFENVGQYELVEDASSNWRLGQDWMGCMDSAMRHIEAWKSGEDFDSELGTYHLANAAWGMFSLLEFYKIFPQGDNRPHNYLADRKIGLDIDEVLADWVGDWTDMRGIGTPSSWYFDRELLQKFEEMKANDTLDEFYMNIKPLIKPEDIPFEPHCYITSRPVDSAVSEAWLAKHGFPARPVFTTTKERTKVVIAKEQGLDIFVDDGWHNFKALNNAGICTFLMDAGHNRRYDVGFKRIKSLKELV